MSVIDIFNYKKVHGHEGGRRQYLRTAFGILLVVLLLAGAGGASTVTYKWSFPTNVVNNDSWVFSYVQNKCISPAFDCKIRGGNTSADGIPAGSLFANITRIHTGGSSKNINYSTSWMSPNFSWVNGTPSKASLNFSLKNASSSGSSIKGTFIVTLIKPDNSRVLIYPTAALNASSSGWLTFSNSSMKTSDFSQNGNYRILLNATLDATASNKIDVSLEVRWDNPNITLVGKDITPPSVTSNTNNVYVANNTFVSLNASITDTDTGVKNATVNVSQINFTIKEAVLTLTGGYWVNNIIIANKGGTNGFKNLTITAYDNAGNRNNTINMTVGIRQSAPGIISWGNNNTNNQSLFIIVPVFTSVKFNVTANQTITTHIWTYDNAGQNQNFNNFTKQFEYPGRHYINISVTNNNGTDYKNWTVRVNPASWDSYNDSAHSYVNNNFIAGQQTVYMYGTGFGTNYSYKVVYYDGNNTKRSTDASINTDPSGNMSSYYIFASGMDVAGTWHAQVFNASISPPDIYDATNPDVIADDSFDVDIAAIPEFPAGIVLPFAASLILYAFMRKKYAKK
ncbi:MAG: hypothetical protein WCE94_07450 [Candidatus Methanoperedens sp.]